MNADIEIRLYIMPMNSVVDEQSKMIEEEKLCEPKDFPQIELRWDFMKCASVLEEFFILYNKPLSQKTMTHLVNGIPLFCYLFAMPKFFPIFVHLNSPESINKFFEQKPVSVIEIMLEFESRMLRFPLDSCIELLSLIDDKIFEEVWNDENLTGDKRKDFWQYLKGKSSVLLSLMLNRLTADALVKWTSKCHDSTFLVSATSFGDGSFSTPCFNVIFSKLNKEQIHQLLLEAEVIEDMSIPSALFLFESVFSKKSQQKEDFPQFIFEKIELLWLVEILAKSPRIMLRELPDAFNAMFHRIRHFIQTSEDRKQIEQLTTDLITFMSHAPRYLDEDNSRYYYALCEKYLQKPAREMLQSTLQPIPKVSTERMLGLLFGGGKWLRQERRRIEDGNKIQKNAYQKLLTEQREVATTFQFFNNHLSAHFIPSNVASIILDYVAPDVVEAVKINGVLPQEIKPPVTHNKLHSSLIHYGHKINLLFKKEVAKSSIQQKPEDKSTDRGFPAP